MTAKYSDISKEDLVFRTYEIDTNNILVGYAPIDSGTNEEEWQIKKISTIGSETIELFPLVNGKRVNKFIFRWDDKLTLTY